MCVCVVYNMYMPWRNIRSTADACIEYFIGESVSYIRCTVIQYLIGESVPYIPCVP